MADREIILGVDFGTSYTSAGALIDGRVELVQDAGDPAIPSVVYVPRSGELVVGHPAACRAASDPAATITSVKRLLNLPPTSEAIRRLAPNLPYGLKLVGGRVVVATAAGDIACEQLTAAIFAKVRDLAERRFGGRARRIVATIPAATTPHYVDAIRRAARLAHLEVVQIVSEPIAGALALGLHGETARRRLIVCDFGGGTFDVTAVVQEGLRFSPVAMAGEEFLGGDDLDAAMASAVAGAIYKRERFNILDDRVRHAQLLHHCESAKRTLSTQPEVPFSLRDAYVANGARKAVSLVLERAWIEPTWQPIIDRAVACVSTTIARARWQPADVDQVVLIGGSSAVPLFRETLARAVGADRISTTPLAGVAVAMGATLLTARFVSPGGAIPVLSPPTLEDDGIPIFVG